MCRSLSKLLLRRQSVLVRPFDVMGKGLGTPMQDLIRQPNGVGLEVMRRQEKGFGQRSPQALYSCNLDSVLST